MNIYKIKYKNTNGDVDVKTVEAVSESDALSAIEDLSEHYYTIEEENEKKDFISTPFGPIVISPTSGTKTMLNSYYGGFGSYTSELSKDFIERQVKEILKTYTIGTDGLYDI